MFPDPNLVGSFNEEADPDFTYFLLWLPESNPGPGWEGVGPGGRGGCCEDGRGCGGQPLGR